ncbi:Peroxidase 9 [Dionaea muscipula]
MAFTSYSRVDVEGNTCSNYCERLFKSTHAISLSTFPHIFHSIIGHLVDGYYRIHIAELLTRSRQGKKANELSKEKLSCQVLMATLNLSSSFFMLVFLPSFMLSLGDLDLRVGWGVDSSYDLCPEFYDFSCPQANEIVMSVLRDVISQEPRMAASLLRLHFHDCFVQGCDASVLLDDSGSIASEKRAAPNANSLRGFEVIDEIKSKIEEACPETVSCADILALAARGSTLLSGGPFWDLPLGRKDSRTANLVTANSSIPAPTSTIQNLIASFNQQGLDQSDLVALSGKFNFCVWYR